jgi:putative mRNA 3-end processing factor
VKLLEFTSKGIYCPPGDFYIDPWKPVKIALITHAHADHSRWGNQFYIAHKDSVPVMKLRLGEEINVTAYDYGKSFDINGVKVSLHPAGHIIGSAQVRVEHKGEVWVASGDYKLEDDGICPPFEPVKCHTFITESTFGLPVFRWEKQEKVFSEINKWWKSNQEKDKVTVLAGYSLGKAQRLIQGLDTSLGKIYCHGAVQNTNEVLWNAGIKTNPTIRVTKEIPKADFKGNIIIAPPSALDSPWMKRFAPYSTGIASGWMALRGTRRRRSVDKGFVLSDHVDWDSLCKAIKETGAENIYVTHGYTANYVRWLKEQGYNAMEAKTEFTGDLLEETIEE